MILVESGELSETHSKSDSNNLIETNLLGLLQIFIFIYVLYIDEKEKDLQDKISKKVQYCLASPAKENEGECE